MSVSKGSVGGLTGYVLPRFSYVDGLAASDTHGVGVRIVNASTGEVNVLFGRYFFKSTTGSPVLEFSTAVNSNYRWRVSKSRNPLSVGGLTTTRWQRKNLTNEIFSTQDIAELQFNNVEIGKTYRINLLLVAYKTVAGGNFTQVNAFVRSEANGLGTLYARASAQHHFGASGEMGPAGLYANSLILPGVVFTAVSSTVYVRVDLPTNMAITSVGAGGSRSFAILEELPLHSETTQWT